MSEGNFEYRTVYIARHGERLDHTFVEDDWKAKYPHLDYRDSPLSEIGIRQSQELAERIKAANLRNPCILASPFFRTVQTAVYIAKTLRVPLFCEWGFVENLGKGKFSDLPPVVPVDKLRRDFPCIDDKYESQWRLDELRAGETSEDIACRTKRTVDALLRKYDGDLVIVSHSSTCRILTHELIRSNPDFNAQPKLKPAYCSVSSVRVLLDLQPRACSPHPRSSRQLRRTHSAEPVLCSLCISTANLNSCCDIKLKPGLPEDKKDSMGMFEQKCGVTYKCVLEQQCDVSHLSLKCSPNNLRREMREKQHQYNAAFARPAVVA